MNAKVSKIGKEHLDWVRQIFNQHWGGDFIVTRGRVHRPEELEGYIFKIENEKAGLITYKIENQELEITSLNSFEEGKGIGAALLNQVVELAKERGSKRIWLITTNDNLSALRFYQKRGFHLVKVHPNALETSRKLKPAIPEIGEHGIPLRDEIELEMRF